MLKSTLQRSAVFLALFFSGFSGLVYQVTWQKHLAILLGSHASATAAVLALFFLFLSFGYQCIGKYSSRVFRNPLLGYAVIELMIGIYGLYSPYFFNSIYKIFLTSSISQGGLVAALPLCAAFIGVPTFLMGGTIPLLTQALTEKFEDSGDVHAKVYGVNALGAFVGCVAAGFFFLEHLGVNSTLLVAGNLNVLVAFLAGTVALRSKNKFLGPPSAAIEIKKTPVRWGLLTVSFLSGFYTFSLENLLIRMAGISLGGTTFTYTIVVASFILAIAVGSLTIARYRGKSIMGVYAGVLGLGFLSCVVLFISIPYWPIWFNRVRLLFQSSLMNFVPYQFTVFALMSLLLLIPVALLGANLPMLFGALKQKSENLSAGVGRLYAVNSLGSVLGATVGGYWIFFLTNADGALRLNVLLVGFAALIVLFFFLQGTQRLLYAIPVVLMGAFLLVLPKWTDSHFVPGYFYIDEAPKTALNTDGLAKARKARGDTYLFSEMDPSLYVVVTQGPSGERTLYLNGKPDAGTVSDAKARSMAVLTPMMLKPTPVKRAFIVGLGGGLSTGLLTAFPEVESVQVAEISSAVLNSLKMFLPFDVGLEDRMDKVSLQVGDAYKILISETHTYDLIVSEPTSTWVSGVEKLFSTEFYQAGADRLAADGMYVQWFPLFSMDAEQFRRVLKSFVQVFPNATAFAAAGGTLTLIGTKEPFAIQEKVANQRFQSASKLFTDVGLAMPAAVWARQVLTTGQIRAITNSKEVPAHSIFNTTLEYASARAFFAGINLELHTLLAQLAPSSSPSVYLASGIQRPLTAEEVLAAYPARSNFWSQLETHLLVLMAAAKGEALVAPEARGNINAVRFLLGQGPRPEISFDLLALNFRKLQAAGEAPKLSKLLEPLKSCGELSGERCLQIKQQVVAVLGPSIGTQDFVQIIQAYHGFGADPELSKYL